MLRFAPAAALLALAAGCSLAASHYGNRIVFARSAAAAAPLAAPFLLSAMGAASGVALGAAALCDAVAPERRNPRRRRSA